MPTKKQALSATKQRLLETAAAQNLFGTMYLHTVLAQTSLPYREPDDGVRTWERINGNVALRLAAREVAEPDTKRWVNLGLPFGPKARLVLAHLCTEAIITGKPEVETADTVTRFVSKALGMDPKGRNIRSVKDQLARLAGCSIGLALRENGHALQIHTRFTSAFDLWSERDEGERVLWPKTIKFSSDYFESLVKHAVPLNEAHLAALSHSSMGLDIYSWLAQRLHRVKQGVPESITWASLHAQFGMGYAEIREFRRVFKVALEQVLLVYRAAHVEQTESGLTLFFSQPPVPLKAIVGPWKNL